jgi:hypothetical protein
VRTAAIARGKKLEKVLPLMLKMVSESRRNNQFCRPVMSNMRTAINLASLRKHGTIEVRLHQGSTNFEKISNWIDFLYYTSRAKKAVRNAKKVTNVKQFKNYVGRPLHRISAYIDERIKAVA